MNYLLGALISGLIIYVFWGYIKNKLTGKNIVILGDAQTGKTTLHHYLRNGKIPINPQKTGNKDKLEGKIISMDEIVFNISEGEDIGGDDIFFKNNWKDMFLNSDSCIYLIDSLKVLNNDELHLRRVKQQIAHLINWKKDKQIKNKKFKLIIIGSFLDKVINLDNLDLNQVVNKKIEIYTKLKETFFEGDIKPTDFHLGSLAKEDYAVLLIKTILLDLTGINNWVVNKILKYL